MLGTDVVRRPPFMQCVHQVWLDTSVDVSRALLGHITTASAMAPVMPSLLTLVDALMAFQSMASNARQTPVKQVGLAHPHDTWVLSHYLNGHWGVGKNCVYQWNAFTQVLYLRTNLRYFPCVFHTHGKSFIRLYKFTPQDLNGKQCTMLQKKV